MTALSSDLRYAFRALRCAPGSTLPAVVCLALGIAANSTVFSAVDAVLFRPLPLREPDRLVVMWQRLTENDTELLEISYPDFREWQARSRAFEEMTAVTASNWSFSLKDRGDPYPVEGSLVSGSFFEVVGARALLGRTFLQDEDRLGAGRVAVLSHALWQRGFGGDPGVIARNVTLSGRVGVNHHASQLGAQTFTVVGVMPPEFRFPYEAELWLPAGPELADKPGLGALQPIGRLKAGVGLEQARSEMDSVVQHVGMAGTKVDGLRVVMVPLLKHVFGDARLILYVLWAAVGLVQLAACANVAGLALVRAPEQRREVAVRMALGAARWDLTRGALVRSGLLTLTGGALGLILAQWSLRVFVGLSPVEVTRLPGLEDATLDGRALVFAGALVLFSSLGLGLATAAGIHLSSSESLIHQAGGSARNGSVRNFLVAAQVALAVVLSTGAGLLWKTFFNLRQQNLGYQRENILTLNLDPPSDLYPTLQKKRSFYQNVLERIESLPGVVSAGAVLVRPLEPGGPTVGWDLWLILEGQPIEAKTIEKNPLVNWEAVTLNYFRTMGIQLLQGRTFDDHDTEEAPGVVIVSKALALQLWPGEDPIGKRLMTMGGRWDKDRQPLWQSVVGVVDDARYRHLRTPHLDLYVPFLQAPLAVQHLMVRTTTDPVRLAAAIRAEVEAADKRVPVDRITTMEELVDQAVSPWRFNLILVGISAAVAVTLALVGILAVVANAVAQRTREIGIRMALGARSRQVIELVLRQGMAVTWIGLAVGVGLSVVLTRFLSALLYGVEAMDPVTYLSVMGLINGVACLARVLPARRATEVDPMIVLRHE